MDAYQDTITFIADDVIYSFDSQLNPIDTQNFVGQQNEIIDFIFRYDGYQLLVEDQNLFYLKYYDLNGNLTQTIDMCTLRCMDFVLFNDRNYAAVLLYLEYGYD